MRIYSPVPIVEPEINFGLNRHRRTNELCDSKGLTYEGELIAMAAQDAIAVKVGYSEEWHHFVILQHKPNFYTFYAYGGSKPENFAEGDRVEVGEAIFESSYVPKNKVKQFYFEVRESVNEDQLDPNRFFHPYAKHPGVTDPDQASLKVDGIMGPRTWAAWQEALKANLVVHYYGIVDGVPGKITWEAIKNSAILFYDETSIDSEESKIISAVQTKMMTMEKYGGEIDGELNEEAVAALQRLLNSGKYK